MDDRVIPGHECSAWDNLVILIEVQHLKVFKKMFVRNNAYLVQMHKTVKSKRVQMKTKLETVGLQLWFKCLVTALALTRKNLAHLISTFS